MKLIKEKKIYRLFNLLSKKRKKQTYFLFLLLIVNGISESISLLTIIPFLSLILSGGDVDNFINLNINIDKYLPTNIKSYNEILFFLTGIFCFFILFSTILRIINNWYILRLTAKIGIDLSDNIFRNNIYQSYIEYTKKSSSKIIYLVNDAVGACQSALNSLFTITLTSIIGFSIIITLLIYSWRIVLISLLFLGIYYLLISKKVKKLIIENGKILSINLPLKVKIIQESFMGFRDIFINGTEKIYINLFNKYDSIIKIKEADSQLFILLPKFLIEGITLFFIAILGFIISSSNSQNSEFIALLGAFVYALQRLLPLGQQTYAAWAGYKGKDVFISYILNELENEPFREKNLLKNKKLIFSKSILFKKVSYSYDNSKKVLKNVDITINKGDHIGIYGKTGSGKSTLLDLIMGLIPPNTGKILIDDTDMYKNKSNYQWISLISHVPQMIFLKEGTIAENIAFGEDKKTINYELLEKSSRIAQIYNFIQGTKNGYNTTVGEGGIRLSGGQRQRIAIARALYKSRPILVLDEATSAIDANTEKTIIDSILENYKNLTIIMVTHKMAGLKNFNKIFKLTSTGTLEYDKS